MWQQLDREFLQDSKFDVCMWFWEGSCLTLSAYFLSFIWKPKANQSGFKLPVLIRMIFITVDLKLIFFFCCKGCLDLLQGLCLSADCTYSVQSISEESLTFICGCCSFRGSARGQLQHWDDEVSSPELLVLSAAGSLTEESGEGSLDPRNGEMGLRFKVTAK